MKSKIDRTVKNLKWITIGNNTDMYPGARKLSKRRLRKRSRKSARLAVFGS